MTAATGRSGARRSDPPASRIEPAALLTKGGYSRRLVALLGGRLIAAGLLLGGALSAASRPDGGFTGFTSSWVLGLIGATFLSAVGFGFWTRSGRRPEALIATQLVWDLALATGLVYCTGGAGSALSALYEIVVLVAALMLGGRGLRATAVLALALYVTVGVSLATGWLPAPPDQSPHVYLLETTELGFALLSNVLGLMLVGALAGVLTVRLRRAGGALAEAQRSAERYARLADDIVRSIGSGLATVDADGSIESLNPAGVAMLGGDEEYWRGRPASEFLPEPQGEDPTPATRGEGLARRADGTLFPMGFTTTPLLQPEGAPQQGTLLSFQDLTEIVELRARTERARRLAFLGQLAAGVAHEVRNPLSSISGSVQMVQQAPGLDEGDRELMAIVLGEVDRLDHLVRAMLSAGTPNEPDPHPVDLSALAAGIVKVASLGRAQARGIKIVGPTRTSGVVCRGDEDPLRQVLWNLLDNAVAAAPDGSEVTVEVSLEGPDVLLKVRDRGEGIAPEARDSLFELFSSGRAHGVGIGMALVRQIVTRLGGEVTLAPLEPRGTEVRVSLAASQVD